MTNYPCPHCKKTTLSLRKKYLAGKWIDVYCPQCNGRIAMHPILLGLLSTFYVWDVMLFGYVAYLKQSWIYVGVMVTAWIILDLFNLSLPLVGLKKITVVQKEPH